MEKLIKSNHMYIKRTLTYFTIILLLIACRNKPTKNNQIVKEKQMNLTKNQINEIKQHLEYQKRIVSDELDPEDPYELTPKDLELASKEIGRAHV